jgi:hypothetical protein
MAIAQGLELLYGGVPHTVLRGVVMRRRHDAEASGLAALVEQVGQVSVTGHADLVALAAGEGEGADDREIRFDLAVELEVHDAAHVPFGVGPHCGGAQDKRVLVVGQEPAPAKDTALDQAAIGGCRHQRQAVGRHLARAGQGAIRSDFTRGEDPTFDALDAGQVPQQRGDVVHPVDPVEVHVDVGQVIMVHFRQAGAHRSLCAEHAHEDRLRQDQRRHGQREAGLAAHGVAQ